MNRDIIVSRQCSVGPDGFFSHGADRGPVTVSINFYRPVPHPEHATDHRCTYEIKYGDDTVRTFAVSNIDGVSALLAAMRFAVIDLETGCLDKWRVSIPKEYLDDMRCAATAPCTEELMTFKRNMMLTIAIVAILITAITMAWLMASEPKAQSPQVHTASTSMHQQGVLR